MAMWLHEHRPLARRLAAAAAAPRTRAKGAPRADDAIVRRGIGDRTGTVDNDAITGEQEQ